jgi:hypothetical protein
LMFGVTNRAEHVSFEDTCPAVHAFAVDATPLPFAMILCLTTET